MDSEKETKNKEIVRSLLNGATLEIFPDSRMVDYFKGADFEPKHIAVTSSPTKPIEFGLSVALEIADLGHDVTAHISARNVKNLDHLEEIGQVLLYKKIRKIMIVAGDTKNQIGEFGSSTQVIEGIAELGLNFDKVMVAGYPEGHPFITEDELNSALLEKQKLAREFGINMEVVTQMGFSAEALNDWIRKQRAVGMTLPVVAGLSAPVDLPTIAMFAAKIGFTQSSRFLKNIELSKELIKNTTGSFDPLPLIQGLAESGNISGVRFFTFNEVLRAQNWIKDNSK